MPKFLRITLLVAVALVVIGFIYLKLTAAGEGDQAPEIQAELVDGTNFKLSDLQGDYVLLNFWGSWCGPCRVKTPSLIALHQKYESKLKVVSVALEKNAEAGRVVAKKDGFTWKYQIVEESSFVMLSSTAQKYGVTEIPTMFLISPEGILLGKKSLSEVEEILKKE
ncbi:MAG: TlpA family protein disulfide reductase [Crocinitomicaceae bacterium]|nr:TlpA family protein disulfide reductase [Flavobacteriales bacterium]NQZ34091.1 TlpA family protein disulfide reductase [Crocinitomicaceae bacterium]